MPKWGIGLLMVGSLLVSTTARSITQFELTPESSSAPTKSTAPSSHRATHTQSDPSAPQNFPQVGDQTISPLTGLIWLVVVGGVSVWLRGRRHAA